MQLSGSVSPKLLFALEYLRFCCWWLFSCGDWGRKKNNPRCGVFFSPFTSVWSLLPKLGAPFPWKSLRFNIFYFFCSYLWTFYVIIWWKPPCTNSELTIMNYCNKVLQLRSTIRSEKQLYCLLAITEKKQQYITICSLRMLLTEMTVGST